MQLSAVHYLLHTLEEVGVTHIFGVPGGPLVPLYEALAERQHIQPILAKHEEGAAFMAEGYARVRRGLGVCFGTSGPGSTNALTGVASAYSDSIPLLFLSAQVSTSAFGKGAAQDSSGGHWNLDIVDIFRSATKLSTMLTSAQQMPHLTQRVLRTALTGRQGAVHLNVPANLMKQQIAITGNPYTAKFCSQAKPAGDPRIIAQMAERLCAAKHPVIFAGHGVNLAGAWKPLLRIAETLQIPVATTTKGKSAFPEDHALSLGVFGLGGGPFSSAYLLSDEVDTLVIIGTSMGELQTNGWNQKLSSGRTVLQIDIDPQEIGKNYPVDMSIVGDADVVLSALADQINLSAPVTPPNNGWLLKRTQAEHQHIYKAEALQGSSPLLKPQALVARMSEIVPAETLLFVDNSSCLSWAGQFYVAREPGTVFIALNLASIGYAGAASIGGKIAAPERPVIALLGDGAFGMHGMELHTAAEYNIPVIWVVLNNGGHGMVYTGEKLLCGQSFSSVFHRPLDIATIARGLGVQAYKVNTLDEFTFSLGKALQERKPCVIDACVDLEQVPYALQRRVQTLNSFFGQENSK